MRVRSVILWLPSVILAITAVVVIVITVTNSSKRLTAIEDQLGKKNTVLTFVFMNGNSRFRIICKDVDNTGIYQCTTINLNPTPTPSPTK